MRRQEFDLLGVRPTRIHDGVGASGAAQPVPSYPPVAGFPGPVPSIAGCQVWIDFSDITTLWKDTSRTIPVTTNADLIKGVTDKSGHAVHLAEATNPPLWANPIQNGLGGARFDGVNDLLTSIAINFAQPGTVFVVAKSVSGTLSRRFLDANTGRWILGPNYAGTVKYYAYAGGAVEDTTANSANAWNQHSVIFSGNSSTYRIDQTNFSLAVGIGTSNLSTTFYLGAASGLAQFDAVDYGEFLIYDSALSVPNQLLVEAYLKAKWGTP